MTSRRIADHGHFDLCNILSSINLTDGDESDTGDGQSTLKLQQALSESEELESHCLLITDLRSSDSADIHSSVNPTGDESAAGDELPTFELQQALTESEEPESHSLLIADLGYRGTFKIDSIVNIITNDEEDDEVDEHFIFRRLCAPNPDVQESRITNSQAIATTVEGQVCFDEHTEFSSHDDIIPTIEAGASQNETMFADRGHPTWVLDSVGGASVNDVNRKTRALEKDNLQTTSGPEPRRAKIGSSS